MDRGDGLDDSVSGEGVGEREDLDRAEVDVEEAQRGAAAGAAGPVSGQLRGAWSA